jgi:hypothetical protein
MDLSIQPVCYQGSIEGVWSIGNLGQATLSSKDELYDINIPLLDEHLNGTLTLVIEDSFIFNLTDSSDCVDGALLIPNIDPITCSMDLKAGEHICTAWEEHVMLVESTEFSCQGDCICDVELLGSRECPSSDSAGITENMTMTGAGTKNVSNSTADMDPDTNQTGNQESPILDNSVLQVRQSLSVMFLSGVCYLSYYISTV